MKRLLFLLPLLAIAAHAAPVPLFDGKSLDGWDYDPAIWRVEDGMITGGSTTEKIKANYFICTRRSYQNFELRMRIKCSGDPKTGLINSGIQIRSLRVPGGAHMSGYQVDCGAGWFGKIYDEFRRNKVIAEPLDAAALDKAVDVFGWNEYRIRAEGPRIQVWINGVAAIDYTEQDRNIALDGQLGPQVHSGGVALVQVKDVTIEELPPTPGAPTWESLGGVEAARAKVAPPKKGAAAPAKPMKPGNAAEGAPKSAQEQQKLFHLPEGFEIELVVQESDGIGKFVSVYFDQRGRMWTQTAFEYPVDANENPAAAEALYQSKGKDKVLVYPRESLNAAIPAGGLTNPTVFTDGLAIPLGILPWGNGDTCYIQHGHDLKLFKDTNGDGRADTSEVILTGFGVQDSHLFPHQFTRAPGGWIWMAQGLFNNSKVRKPDGEAGVDWPKCSMAKMRPDGSQFEVTSTGPNNIWGLVITGEGEAFIQEANDYGYPVMPFHEYAYYPGGMEALKRSYQPDFPPQAEFRMGGTGLSGLALGEGAFRKLAPTVKDDGLCMFVANPITSKVQTLAMHRDGPYWKLEQAADLVTCDDPFFRPVALTNGPDGCIYIVDWYNKIISHNEVPRNHPDRDKTRGRIWRVKSSHLAPRDRLGVSKSPTKPETTPTGHLAERDGHSAIPDFTKLSGDELIAMLGAEPLAQSHLAWQTIIDRGMKELAPRLREIVSGVGWASRPPGDASRVADPNVEPRANANSRPDVSRETRATAGGTPTLPDATRIAALWALEGIEGIEKDDVAIWDPVLGSPNRNVRREAVRALRAYVDFGEYPRVADKRPVDGRFFAAIRRGEADPEVRAEMIRTIGGALSRGHSRSTTTLHFFMSFALAPMEGPTAPSTRNGKPIKIREAYDREFERYLIRMFLEKYPTVPGGDAGVAAPFLRDQGIEFKEPAEALLLASLALAPREMLDLSLSQGPVEKRGSGATRVAKLLPQLQRPPGQEEILRLAQFPNEPGVGDALRAILSDPKTGAASLESLLAVKTRLDPKKLTPFLNGAANTLLASKDAAGMELGIRLAGAFQLAATEGGLADVTRTLLSANLSPEQTRIGGSALRALASLGSNQTELFSDLAESSPDALLRDEALAALASSKAADAPARVLALYQKLAPSQRRTVLERLSATKPGAGAILAALHDSKLAASDLDASILDRMQAVLGAKDPALAKLTDKLGALFRPVLALDGTETAWTQTTVTLEGPCTIEAWVRLDPDKRKIGNADGIAGAPGQLDFNFFAETPRIYAFPPLADVAVAKKPITPGIWTHVAATRDAKGIWKIYIDGELNATGTKPAPHQIEKVRIAWTSANGGTRGALSEVRMWNRERSADEIRGTSDRSLEIWKPDPALKDGSGNGSAKLNHGLIFASPSGDWGALQAGAKVVKTSDYPPILTGDEAAALDAKYAKFRSLAEKPGDAAKGKMAALVCQACHLFGTTGGNIGPNLSGVGAMGTEAILRNILQPNAAMEAGYRIYRVELKNGDLLDAMFVSEDKAAIVVRMPGAEDRRIPKTEIRSAKFLRRSLMPEGLIDGMTPEQVSDLFAYLKTLK